MATVNGFTADRSSAILAQSLSGGSADSSGHLILSRNDTTAIDAGSVTDRIPAATSTELGVVQLATTAESQSATNTTKAVTPQGINDIVTALSDTGWVTSGLSFILDPNWILVNYSFRRSVGHTAVYLYVRYIGSVQLKAGVDGQMTDINGLIQIPAEWSPPAVTSWQGVATRSGASTWFMRWSPSGTIDMTHGLPNAVINTNDYLTIGLEYDVI